MSCKLNFSKNKLSEKLVNSNVSQKFASVSDIDTIINETLKKMSNSFDLNTAYIMRADFTKKIFYLSHFAVGTYVISIDDKSVILPLERNSRVYKNLLKGIPWVVDEFKWFTKETAEFFEHYSNFGFIAFPIINEGDIYSLICYIIRRYK